MPVIWVSYKHGREGDELLKQLIELVKDISGGRAEVDSDKRLRKDDFFHEIKDKINRADHHILLVTEDFLSSEWCNKECLAIKEKNEIPTILTNITCFDRNYIKNTESDLSVFKKSDYKIITSDPNLKERTSNQELHLHVKDLLHRLGVNKDDNDTTALSRYKSTMDKGLFVPFIGPSCNNTAEEWEPAYPKLNQTLEAVKSSDTSGGRVVTEYILSLVEQRIPGARENLDVSNLHPPAAPSPQTDPQRAKLIVAVAHAAISASHIIGTALNNNSPLVDARIFGAEVSVVQADDAHLLENIENAIKEAETMMEKKDCVGVQGPKRVGCIGSYGIVSGLKAIKKHLYDETPQPLLLVQVEWLVELLWHTIRYDLCVMPSNEEFAFHFALCQAEECLTRTSLGMVGIAANDASANRTNPNIPSPYDCIAGISRIGFTNNPSPKLYTQIAKMLINACSNTRGYEANDVMLPSHEQSKINHQNEVTPLAVSLNLDTRLEDSLQESEYSVIFPVEVGENRGDYLWMLRVESKTGKEFHLLINKHPFDTCLRRTIKWPLIVKLRGSYLHELPPGHILPRFLDSETHRSLGSCVPSGAHVKNRVTVSSLDYAKEMFYIDPGPPEFLREMLNRDDIVMCFLGYPLDDPDAALSIQQAVWMAANTASKAGSKISVGCERYDKLGKAFLKGLKIDPLDINVNSFTNELKHIL